MLEYFIASHGARKGLADTAMKTADAGYLTRRLVDVSHDVIISEEDCGTLRGLVCTALKNGDEVISSLSERIIGRVSVHDVVDPTTGEVLVSAGEEITEAKAKMIDESPIERRDSFSAHLREQEGCLHEVLRSQPCHTAHGSAWRGCRRYRCTGHR